MREQVTKQASKDYGVPLWRTKQLFDLYYRSGTFHAAMESAIATDWEPDEDFFTPEDHLQLLEDSACS